MNKRYQTVLFNIDRGEGSGRSVKKYLPDSLSEIKDQDIHPRDLATE